MTRAKHPKTRSAVTNGSRVFLRRIDGRGPEARRFEDILAEVHAMLGGEASMTIIQKAAARAFASLCVAREVMEQAQVEGKAFDAEAYGQLCDRMDRQARRLGEPEAPIRPSAREHVKAPRIQR